MSPPNLPHEHHSDDAIADNEAPTDAVTDDVRRDSAPAEPDEAPDPPTEPALTHP